MKVTPPTIPFHLARVYGVQMRPTVQPVNPVSRLDAPVSGGTDRIADQVRLTDPVQSVRPTESGRETRIESLVAARVPGGIRFTEYGAEPSERGADLQQAKSIRSLLENRAEATRESLANSAIPMYRNPAMKNAAAASIAHSRGTIDLRG